MINVKLTVCINGYYNQKFGLFELQQNNPSLVGHFYPFVFSVCPSTILCLSCFHHHIYIMAIVIIDSGPDQNVRKMLLSSDVLLERVYYT